MGKEQIKMPENNEGALTKRIKEVQIREKIGKETRETEDTATLQAYQLEQARINQKQIENDIKKDPDNEKLLKEKTDEEIKIEILEKNLERLRSLSQKIEELSKVKERVKELEKNIEPLINMTLGGKEDLDIEGLTTELEPLYDRQIQLIKEIAELKNPTVKIGSDLEEKEAA